MKHRKMLAFVVLVIALVWAGLTVISSPARGQDLEQIYNLDLYDNFPDFFSSVIDDRYPEKLNLLVGETVGSTGTCSMLFSRFTGNWDLYCRWKENESVMHIAGGDFHVLAPILKSMMNHGKGDEDEDQF